MADRAAPGDARSGHDLGAIVGVLGELEGRDNDPVVRSEDEELPPLNLEPLKRDEARARTDE